MLAAMDMNVEKIVVNRYSLGNLMWSMAQGTLRIPRFQREFVWSRNKIIDLLDSMYKEYPIGTIFLWEAPAEFNHMLRTVTYLQQPDAERNKAYTLILDGQQRLTSLYAVVNGLKIEDEDYGKFVFDLAATAPENLFRYRQPDNKRWVAVQDILKNDNSVYDGLTDSDYRKRFSRCFQLLNTYPFSVVLVKDVDIEDAIEIFERINRAGKQLTRYDLITASVLTDSFDLREKTNTAIVDPLRNVFGEITETSIPQALALNIKGNTEHKTQMELQPDEVEPVWDETVRCFKLAIDFVHQNLGVVRSSFLPYDGMLPVLAYYFYYGQTDAVISPHHKRQLEYWFWRVAFSERYSGASQTRMSEDAAWIRDLIGQDKPFAGDITTTIDGLMHSSMRSSSAMRNGFLCLLSLQNPLHFKNGAPLSLSREEFSSVTSMDSHHIFSADFLERLGYRRQDVHFLSNFCFLPAELNRWIADKAPSEYMQEIRDEFGPEHFERVMASHLIPASEGSGLWTDNYERFLRQRSELLLSQIRQIAGISDALPSEHRNPIVDLVETALRDLVHDNLMIGFGLDYWNRQIPRDIVEKVDQRIESEARRKPGVTKAQFNEPRAKLDFCDVSDYEKIILSNRQQFPDLLKSRREFEIAIRDFNEFRNAVKHNRAIDAWLQRRAEAAVIWFAKLLDLDLSVYNFTVE